MADEIVAIVGSADPARTYDPPMKDAAAAQAAAAALGKALAERGCRLIVYHREFIEQHVVQGYLVSGKAREKSIEIHYPAGMDMAKFTGFDDKNTRAVFDPQASSSSSWEVSFYRSLSRVQGLILIGGGRSTQTTGLIALAFRVPVVALRAFGGGAAEVWGVLRAGSDLPTQEQVNVMAADWEDDMAAHLVDGLLDQQRRRRQELRSRGPRRTATGAVLLALWAATFPLGWIATRDDGLGFYAALFLVPLMAGAAGAAIRLLVPAETTEASGRAVVLGAAGGLVSSILYLMSQLVADTVTTPRGRFSQMLLASVVGFLAGLTFDAVFRKLQTVDVVRTEALTGSKKP